VTEVCFEDQGVDYLLEELNITVDGGTQRGLGLPTAAEVEA
jgi:hypothetical protein